MTENNNYDWSLAIPAVSDTFESPPNTTHASNTLNRHNAYADCETERLSLLGSVDIDVSKDVEVELHLLARTEVLNRLVPDLTLTYTACSRFIRLLTRNCFGSNSLLRAASCLSGSLALAGSLAKQEVMV